MSNARVLIRELAVLVTLSAAAAVFGAVGGSPTAAAQSGPLARFTGRTVGTPIPGGYQIVAVDLNKDGRLDLLALGLSPAGDLVWFENPTWQRHVVSSEFTNMVNLAPYDLDGDGIPEIALAHGFTTSPETSHGGISLLTHGATKIDKWTRRDIDALPTAHRVRWVNVDGRKHVVLVNSPLVGAGATPPDYRTSNAIVYYEAPEWKRQTLWETEGLQHGLLPTAGLGHSKVETLLSTGFSGIFQHQFDAGRWITTKLASGSLTAWPKSGTSDVVVGQVNGADFISGIEAWHGNQVVIYQRVGGAWGKRQVIDSQIVDGHALAVGDLAGTGDTAIVVGERNGKKSAYVYWPPPKLGGAWNKQVLDAGMAASGCVVAELSGDRRPDIACIQGAAPNVRWYENMGK